MFEICKSDIYEKVWNVIAKIEQFCCVKRIFLYVAFECFARGVLLKNKSVMLRLVADNTI